MPDKEEYTPVKKGIKPATDKPRRGRPRKYAIKLENADTIEHSDATLKEISEFVATGHKLSSMPILLGINQDVWDAYYTEYNDEITKASAIGKQMANIQAVDWMHQGARNCANVSAFKLYVEYTLGWNGGTGAQELPTGITFTMIKPEEDDNG